MTTGVSANARLNSTYYSVEKPASFSHAKALQFEERGLKNDVVKKWLSKQETHSIHRPARRRFPRRKVIVSGIDDQWQSDLADLGSISRYNKGYRYLLGCIDVFSRYAWIVPLKKKTAGDVMKGLKIIFKQGRKPRKLQTDMGTEFTNSKVQAFLKEEGVSFFFTQNQDIKASLIERFWRTLKGKMYRYFTHKQTKKYIEILPKLLSSYNNTYHRSIGIPPARVNESNEEEVWQKQYGMCEQSKKPYLHLRVGGYVRISKYKAKFDKGYLPNWSREIFIIKGIQNTTPKTFVLEDQSREELKGTFYGEELQLVDDLPEQFVIESILKKRVKNKKKQVLIKWLDYSDKFNSWIDEGDIKRY